MPAVHLQVKMCEEVTMPIITLSDILDNVNNIMGFLGPILLIAFLLWCTCAIIGLILRLEDDLSIRL